MIDRQFKAIAFRGEGKDIEAYVVDCVLAEDCAALIQRAEEALRVAKEAMDERRGYSAGWEWKYGTTWDEEDAQVAAALNAAAEREVGE